MARILVVDDNADVRTVMSGVLAAAGHEVTLAEDGARALEAQRRALSPIVIADILMPEKDGIETIRDLRHEFPSVKIIAMSGSGMKLKNTELSLFVAKEAGADVVLRKPFLPEVLLKTVQELLGKAGGA